MEHDFKDRFGRYFEEFEVGDIYESPVEVLIDGETYFVEVGDTKRGGTREVKRARTLDRAREERPGLRGILQGDDNIVRCPLPGRVVSVSVVKGQTLQTGDEICVLESMKMEQSVRMAHSGVAKSIKVKANQSISAGDPLIELR